MKKQSCILINKSIHLMDFPEEIIMLIFKQIKLFDIHNLLLVSKQFNTLIFDLNNYFLKIYKSVNLFLYEKN